MMTAQTGKAIRRARKRKGMSQWQLSQAVGVTPATIFMIEHGTRDCSMKLLTAIADALGVKRSEIEK